MTRSQLELLSGFGGAGGGALGHKHTRHGLFNQACPSTGILYKDWGDGSYTENKNLSLKNKKPNKGENIMQPWLSKVPPPQSTKLQQNGQKEFRA